MANNSAPLTRLACLYTALSVRVPEMEGLCATGASYFGDVPLVEFVYLVFTCMPGGVTVGDSGLCCCVPCLSSAFISLCLLILYLLFIFELWSVKVLTCETM